MYLVCIFVLSLIGRWHREVISNRQETSCLPLVRPGSKLGGSGTHSPTDWMSGISRSQTGLAISDKVKNLNMMIDDEQYSAHLTPLPELVHPWFWWYTYFLAQENCVYVCITSVTHHSLAKVHGANMVLSAPDGPHVGPMNLAIRV